MIFWLIWYYAVMPALFLAALALLAVGWRSWWAWAPRTDDDRTLKVAAAFALVLVSVVWPLLAGLAADDFAAKAPRFPWTIRVTPR